MARNPLSVWRPLSLDRFLLGAPHYPEHVDESYWVRDAERMAKAGVNTVRMGEFAWHLWEPREGLFDFDLFDRAIAVLADHGINTILCTPTATPPRWLSQNYPEILRVDANGRVAGHGSRQHGDTTSPTLRAHSRRITRALATHYRDNPAVIGWQTDNELNTSASESYSPSCAREFRKWCAARYGTIQTLNRAWGGDFWALAYDDFGQIDLPRDMAPTFLSPGHVQDYHRFLADATAAFQHDQVVILRETNPDWFVFHNLGNLGDIDFRGTFGQDLDFIGFDIYPMLYDEFRRTGGIAATQALHLDQCRAYSGNFIVPEQASGFGAQPGFSTMTPEPGEMRRMAMTSVARGADGVMFFRWRPAHYGAEIYWMGVIDHDDVPRRRYDEASQFFHEMTAHKGDILGTHVRMDLGIAGADFDNQEAYKTYAMGLPSPLEDATILHRAAYRAHVACGFIHPEDDLSRLKALYVPHWVMWKPEWTARVTAFVEAGGTLILSAMTGTRDSDNHIHRVLAPGAGLSALAGVQVEEFGRLAGPGASGLFPPWPDRVNGGYHPAARLPATSADRAYSFTFGNRDFRAAHLYEKLILAPGTEAIGTWSHRFLTGTPVATRRRQGLGQVIYLGTYMTEELAQHLLDSDLMGVAPLIPGLPQGVEVSCRQTEGHRLWFILNTTEMPQTLPALPAGEPLLGDIRPHGAGFTLPAHGCEILRERL
ncbi:beta-galactosidase [Rhodobacter sp. KR11]|uniref:beta-galactosidase n=1 Tax=Rhodobacter sp. KR11 TaxID=2974588 RepID=UPI002222835D|nr:beta-galactosidase [Rhodobacter sp. KR11]MCW1920298.1 beta-galactosidase [Rhodobacter sp. KR11]